MEAHHGSSPWELSMGAHHANSTETHRKFTIGALYGSSLRAHLGISPWEITMAGSSSWQLIVRAHHESFS